MNQSKKSAAVRSEEMTKKKALLAAQKKLMGVSREIDLMDNQIGYLRKLFRRAEKNNGYALRYNLRMQLSIYSGVKVMYHHYVSQLENKIRNLRAKPVGSPLENQFEESPSSSEDSDEDSMES